MVKDLLAFLICTVSSVIGAICGIGGGVIIKPVLDLVEFGSAAEVSFLSSCTVLSMAAYSVLRCGRSRTDLNLRTTLPLALGASLGGCAGKFLFEQIRQLAGNDRIVGGVQAACLTAVTVFTLVYTVRKHTVRTLEWNNRLLCGGIGGVLGVVSSFLGIGGGPLNIIVLHYFFSMPAKTAALNSLFIILFSQVFGLGFSLATNSVPSFSATNLVCMMLGGVLGGVLGRWWNQRMDDRQVDRLFRTLMAAIILICLFNARALISG